MQLGNFLGSNATPVWVASQSNVHITSIEELHSQANEYYNYVRGQENCLTGTSNSLLVAAVYNPTTKSLVAATIPKDANTQKEMMDKALTSVQTPVWGSVAKTWNDPDLHAEDHAYLMAELLGALAPSAKNAQKYGDGTKTSVMIAVWGQMSVPKGSESTVAGLPGTPISLCNDARSGRNIWRSVASFLGVYNEAVAGTLTAKEKQEQADMAKALLEIANADEALSDTDMCVAVAQPGTSKRSDQFISARWSSEARAAAKAASASLWTEPDCKAKKTVTITASVSKTFATTAAPTTTAH